MSFINNIVSWIIKKRIHQIELFMKYPLEVQQEWLTDLVSTAKGTEWGKRYDFQSINRPEEFKERFPIQNYDSMKPFIERMMNGEKNILWPSNITWFAKSSGTTSDKSKFIPVSEESLEGCHFKGGKDMLAIFCNNRPDTRMFTGKGLVMGGSLTVNQLNEDCSYGDLSAVLIQNLPIWAEYLRTPNLSIALMDEWEAKIDKMARATMVENVTSITGVPTWTIILANRILELTGAKDLTEVWPNLELYVHGAVSFTPYRDQFKRLIPSASMYYLETYNASEGFFGIQDQSNSEELLLMLDYGIYYEFLPMESYGDPHAKTLDLSEVALNKNYAIIISTNGGLWRYLIGDTVQFTSLNPFRIKITGRTRHFINAFGEELIIDNAEKALTAASRATNTLIKDYTAGPIYFSDGASGGHEWIIEFERPPHSLEQFTNLLDQHLQQENSDYEAKRYKDIALSKPKVHAAPRGMFYNWMKQRGKLGGQHKVPRLANDRKYLDDLLKLLQETAVD